MRPFLVLPRPVLAVVFDMDGLIFDTEPLYRDAIIAAAMDRGHDMPLPLCLSTIGLTSKETRAVLVAHYGPTFDFDTLWKAAADRFETLVETQLYLKPGVVELLDALDKAGLPRAIATSSSHNSVQHHLAVHGITHRFPEVIAQGDYARGKPSPDPYLKAAERLAIDPAHCLALEDSYNGVRAASGAGMMTVMVPDLLPATAEMEKLCVRIVRDLCEVRDLINM
jgi:HAD superfamily hydrolase (TIGR01509 family)